MNKRLYFILAMVILLVGTAAFVAGRMLNRGVSPLGLIEMVGNGFSLVTDILPAAELPKRSPDAEGRLIERQDNTVFIETSQHEGSKVDGPVGAGGGPKVEVVVTLETIVYQDTTQPPSQRPTPGNNPPIQQTVEIGTLDDLNISQSLVMVWGRKSGDRIIAEVLVYNNPAMIQAP